METKEKITFTRLVSFLLVFLILSGFDWPRVAVQAQNAATFLYVAVGTFSANCKVRSSVGSPEGVLVGNKCDFYLRRDGGVGTILYIKESGTATNTGWVPYVGTGGVGGIGNVIAASVFGTDNRLIRSDGASKDVQASGITIDDSDIVTGMKFDAEGTGNTLTIPAEFYFPWAVCQGGIGSLVVNYKTDAPTAGCITGTNIDWPIATMPDSAGAYNGYWVLPIPGDWVGTVDVRGMARTSLITGDYVMQFKWACTGNGAVANDTWSSASSTTETAAGTTLFWNAWSITSISLTGCAANEVVVGMVFRDRAHGSDTLGAAGVDQVMPVAMKFRRGM